LSAGDFVDANWREHDCCRERTLRRRGLEAERKDVRNMLRKRWWTLEFEKTAQ
jgi:hypothetical protein